MSNEVREELILLMPRLWRFAFSLTRNADSASDLTQSTCLRALSKARQFQPGTRFDAWCFTICRSIWLNEIRAAQIRRTGEIGVFDISDLPEDKSDIETNILARQVLSKIMTLPEAQRETVMLVYVEQFSYKEAAEVLAIPIGTVMSRLSAARQKLVEMVAPIGQEKAK